MHYLEITWEWGKEEVKEFNSMEELKAFQKRNDESIFMSFEIDKPKKTQENDFPALGTLTDYEMDVLL